MTRATRITGFAMTCIALYAGGSAIASPGDVTAKVETEPVVSSGDAADDTCIWIHPTQPELSLVIGTDKKKGLDVYDLAGKRLQSLPDGAVNNVDLRYNFKLGGKSTAIVTAGNRTSNTIEIYRVDDKTRTLAHVEARDMKLAITLYGSCMYRSPVTGDYYFIAVSKDGVMEQWRLFDNGQGKVDGLFVRTFKVGGQCEGCVADDHYAFLYIGEESKGVWRYGAEPNDSSTRLLVDSTGGGGHLTADVEGTSIYYCPDGTGYLIVSSQGSNSFAVYKREPPHTWLTSFKVVNGPTVDGVNDSDGIDVTNFPLGPAFPTGLFTTQDGSNDGGNQNQKLVMWDAIAKTAQLTIDARFDPRNVGSGSALFHTTPIGECVENSKISMRVGGGVPSANAKFAVFSSLELTSDGKQLKDPTLLVYQRLDGAGEWKSPDYLMPPGSKGLTVYGQVVMQDKVNGGVMWTAIVPTRVK